MRLPAAFVWAASVACLAYAIGNVTGYGNGRRRATDDLAPYKAQAEALGKEREQLIARLARQSEQLARLPLARHDKRSRYRRVFAVTIPTQAGRRKPDKPNFWRPSEP